MLQLRRDDVCADCSQALVAGTRAGWDSRSRQVRCLSCLPTPTAPGTTSTPQHCSIPAPGRRVADHASGLP